jgi:pSer/pThr/pTyr-binding forkhead associated (FHA) protein
MQIDLVLVKGPAQIQRRLRLTFSGRKKVVCVGRSPENDVTFDAVMTFSSGRHARFHYTSHRGRNESASLYVTDLGSSNGTFVNEIKIASDAATQLQHGDRIIFGGSHGTKVGERLPAEHVLSPEVVEWAIDLNPSNPTAFPYVEVPNDDVEDGDLFAEEKLLATALIKMRKNLSDKTHEETDAANSCRKRSTSKVDSSAVLDLTNSKSPKRRRGEIEKDNKQLEQEPLLVSDTFKLTPFKKGAKPNSGKAGIPNNNNKSVSVPAPPPISKSPPPPVLLRAVRLGNISTSSLSKLKATLSFSETHWRWSMSDPHHISGSQSSLVKLMLPITSVASFMFNRREDILVISLREGVHVPFVEDKLFVGRRSVAFAIDDALNVARCIDSFYAAFHFPPVTELNDVDAAELAPSTKK